MNIYLDLDDVLCDFVGAALKLHGWTRPQWEAVQERGRWEMLTALGMTIDQFWQPIHDAGEAFWVNLEEKVHFRQLLALADHYGGAGNWHIATSPSYSPSSYSGKARWIKDRLGFQFNRIIPIAHKYLLANERSLLIDDRADNVFDFIHHGGKGIIFPAIQNCLHEHSANPIPYVAQKLQELTSCTSAFGT